MDEDANAQFPLARRRGEIKTVIKIISAKGVIVIAFHYSNARSDRGNYYFINAPLLRVMKSSHRDASTSYQWTPCGMFQLGDFSRLIFFLRLAQTCLNGLLRELKTTVYIHIQCDYTAASIMSSSK